ncbi:hypothetical protein [Streptomyces fagopyri]
MPPRPDIAVLDHSPPLEALCDEVLDMREDRVLASYLTLAQALAPDTK